MACLEPITEQRLVTQRGNKEVTLGRRGEGEERVYRLTRDLGNRQGQRTTKATLLRIDRATNTHNRNSTHTHTHTPCSLHIQARTNEHTHVPPHAHDTD